MRAPGGHRSRSRTRSSSSDKNLLDQGFDAGAHTIAVHLARRHGGAAVPSVATIWRILVRRGFVPPQPQKRPRSSFVRFEAEMPNERWQADITHVRLTEEREVEILNMLNDHSRLLVASDALVVFKAADVVASFHRGAAAHGFCASLLTDNGAVFTARRVVDGARSSSSAPGSGSESSTRGLTTRRPAGRSSAFTRR